MNIKTRESFTGSANTRDHIIDNMITCNVIKRNPALYIDEFPISEVKKGTDGGEHIVICQRLTVFNGLVANSIAGVTVGVAGWVHSRYTGQRIYRLPCNLTKVTITSRYGYVFRTTDHLWGKSTGYPVDL